MRARPERLALVIPSHKVGRGCESFEVLGFQRSFDVGSFEQAIRLRPTFLLERLPGATECLHVPHVASLSMVDRPAAFKELAIDLHERKIRGLTAVIRCQETCEGEYSRPSFCSMTKLMYGGLHAAPKKEESHEGPVTQGRR
jgi:hypothetical protein